MRHFSNMTEKFEKVLEQSAYELEAKGYGAAIEIKKEILKKQEFITLN